MTRIGLLLAVLAVSLASGPAASAGPANDEFPGNVVTALPYSTSIDTTNATTATDEPEPSCAPIGATVWWTYKASDAGTVTLKTEGSRFDTVLAVYTTGVDGLVQAACSDDVPGRTTSEVELATEAGAAYYVQVGGYEGVSGLLIFELAEATPLTNDDLPGATIGTVPYTAALATHQATVAPSEPSPPCAPIAATVWWNYTPPSDERIAISTRDSSFDTVVAVYAAGDAGLIPVACDDDGGSFGTSEVNVSMRAGETYYIQAGGYSDAAGRLVFRVGLAPDSNDDFPGQRISELPFLREQSTSDATLEDWEPNRACAAEYFPKTEYNGPVGATVWFSYTATSSDALILETAQSSYDTVVSVFTRNEDGSLSFVACSDDHEDATLYESRLVLVPTAGMDYHIQVGGYTWPNETPGRGSLRFAMYRSRCAEGAPDDGLVTQEIHELEWSAGAARDPLHAGNCLLARSTGL